MEAGAKQRFAAPEQTSDPLDPGHAEKKGGVREAIQAAKRAIEDERAATRRHPDPAECDESSAPALSPRSAR